jgi:hypothetical protein
MTLDQILGTKQSGNATQDEIDLAEPFADLLRQAVCGRVVIGLFKIAFVIP